MLSVVLAASGCAAVPAAAWKLRRTIQFDSGGLRGRGIGTGRLCSSSRFGNWHWRGSVRVSSRGFHDTYRFTWIEPIRQDWTISHLIYTSVHSRQIDRLPERARNAVVAIVKRELNRSRVGWFDPSPRFEFLEYTVPGRRNQIVRFRPQPGC
jgi:hypothetical protein